MHHCILAVQSDTAITGATIKMLQHLTRPLPRCCNVCKLYVGSLSLLQCVHGMYSLTEPAAVCACYFWLD